MKIKPLCAIFSSWLLPQTEINWISACHWEGGVELGRVRKQHHSLGLKSFGPLPAQESHRNCQRFCLVPQTHSSAPKFKNTRTSTKRSYEHFRIFASGRGENLHNQQWLPRRGRVQIMLMGLYQVQYKNWSAMRIVLRIKPCDHQASNRKHTIKKWWIHAIYELASVHYMPMDICHSICLDDGININNHNNNKIKTTTHQQKQQQQEQ